MRKAICFGLVLIMITLCTSLSFAEFNISPSINLMEQYNDNIFLDSANEEEDFILTVSPNIAFNYSSGKVLDITLYYGLNFRYYESHSQLNDDDIDDVQDINAEVHIKLSNNILIDITDTLDKVPVDVRRKSAEDNYNENMTSMNLFTASPHMLLPLTDTISATVGYIYTDTWYNDTSLVGSDTHSAFFTLDKRFSPRINGAVQYGYSAYRPDLDGTGTGAAIEVYDRHDASAVIYYQITPSININAEVGEVWFDYHSANDVADFFWNIGTESDNIIKITENTSAGFNYGIQYNDSPTSGTYRSQVLNLHFETGNVLKFSVDPYYQDIKYLNSDRKDRLVGVSLALSRPLSRKIEVSVVGNLGENKYLSSGEDVRSYSIGGNLHYSLNRKMEIYLGYRFNRQNASSDISNEELEISDYENNIAWLQASVSF